MSEEGKIKKKKKSNLTWLDLDRDGDDVTVGFCFSLAHEEAHQIRPKSLVFC